MIEQFWDVNPWDDKMSVLCGLGSAQSGQGRGKWNISTISAQVERSRMESKDVYYNLHNVQTKQSKKTAAVYICQLASANIRS